MNDMMNVLNPKNTMKTKTAVNHKNLSKDVPAFSMYVLKSEWKEYAEKYLSDVTEYSQALLITEEYVKDRQADYDAIDIDDIEF